MARKTTAVAQRREQVVDLSLRGAQPGSHRPPARGDADDRQS